MLGDHNTLGRHPSNTHQVLDRVVSKVHCHIDRVDGGYRLVDLGSLNGTYLNGRRVTESVLLDGDEIRMGSTTIVFEEADRKPGPPPVPSPSVVPTTNSQLSSRVELLPDKGPTEIALKVDAAPERFMPESAIGSDASLRQDYEKLRASYEVTRAIGLDLGIDGLLSTVLDVAFDLLNADRGVILLYDEAGTLEPRCVRTRESSADDSVLISRTVVDEALRDRAAVLSHDATVDERFQDAQSVIIQGIRSTMAVPLIHQERAVRRDAAGLEDDDARFHRKRPSVVSNGGDAVRGSDSKCPVCPEARARGDHT